MQRRDQTIVQALDWCHATSHEVRGSRTYQHQLLDWMEGAVDAAGALALARLAPERWPDVCRESRRRLMISLGLEPLPARTTPLVTEHVGGTDAAAYRLERLVLEPRPGFRMPVHVYSPLTGAGPFPAVLYSPGHWMVHGKTELMIQSFCIGLARLGFVVMTFDPIGQGERGATFVDHGRRDLLLLGLSQEGLMVWESMRAVDYLLSRPDVDGARIGMTGASGGGLNTLYTCAADERIAVSVPVCYVTSFSRFLLAMRGLNWNNVNDLCNQVPNVVRDLETGGLCGLIHPRPLLIINGTEDPQFPVDGAEQVVASVRGLYAGESAARLRLAAVKAGHGYDRAMREAAYGWFSRWLAGGGDGSPVSEGDVVTTPPESASLRCFRGGQHIRSWNAIRALARTRGSERVKASGSDPILLSGSGAGAVMAFRSRLADCLGLDGHVLEAAVCHGTREAEAGRAERHLLAPEPGIVTPAFVVRPTAPASGVLIHMADEGMVDGLWSEVATEAAANGMLALAVDVRGVGDVTPLPPPQQTVATVEGTLIMRDTQPGDTLEFEAATDAIMLGRPLLGLRVRDILHAVRYAGGLAPDAPVTLVGSGPACSLVALYAAALSDTINCLVLDRLLPSYQLLVEEDEQDFPMSAYVFDILGAGDVPLALASIAPRRVTITRPLGARLQALGMMQATAVLQPALNVFSGRGVPPPGLYADVPPDWRTAGLFVSRP
ncbi:MAG: prolyl oligopeptidase family serine peptidase [Lentisphaerae bacterium]|nr:prolyl oligopeptidase family serine peptidase [Lentisphaerota bacterium]